MSLLDIHVLGSPILRQDTTRVEHITPELRRLVDDMFETMEVAKGVGLAAPQVGRSERLCVVDADDTRLVVINPEIVHKEGGIVRGEEGCLSIPEVYADVDRYARVTVRAQDIDGTWYEIEQAANLLGRCLQHEIDHLHGRLFTDRLSLLKRRAAMKEWDYEKTKYPKTLRVLPVGDLPPEKDATKAAASTDAARP
ncbi:MAG: peptide deformylase [Gemmatimonas sp.]|uniref:peptide deformylase n=1 Tax=Gemmatimonas sp. TaxID=1962908 RepID=UPI00391F3FF7|nr:peptide deformylase [Gemmatimonadota bacterium]